MLDSWKSGRYSMSKVSSLKDREISSSSSMSFIRGLSNTISPTMGNGLNGLDMSTMVLGHGTASIGSLIRLERNDKKQVQITRLINKESTKQYKHHTELPCQTAQISQRFNNRTFNQPWHGNHNKTWSYPWGRLLVVRLRHACFWVVLNCLLK